MRPALVAMRIWMKLWRPMRVPCSLTMSTVGGARGHQTPLDKIGAKRAAGRSGGRVLGNAGGVGANMRE